MLSRAHRITRGDEFRRLFRSGKKRSTTVGTLVYSTGTTALTRVGIVVTKAVGGAVVRNRVKRQIRAIVQPWLNRLGSRDLVIRVAPDIAAMSFAEIKSELDTAFQHIENSS